MTITDLKIANFKAFAASKRLPLRPITLVYGANSSGKSSVLHALALAHHAIQTGDIDTHRTEIGGDSIDLGGFRQYVHRRDDTRQMELGFTLDPTRLSGPAAKLLHSAHTDKVEITIGVGVASKQRDPFVDRTRAMYGDEDARIKRFELTVDGASLLSMSAREGRRVLRLDHLDRSQPLIREILSALQHQDEYPLDIKDLLDIEEDSSALGELLDAIVPSITAKSHGLIPRVDTRTTEREIEHESDLEGALRVFLPEALKELIDTVGTALEDELRRLRYLGPLRSYPPRHLSISSHHDSNWFAGGGYAWDVMRTEESVRRQVNAWLGDALRMQTPYELQVRDMLPAKDVSKELRSRIRKALHDFAASLVAKLADEDATSIQESVLDARNSILEQDRNTPERLNPVLSDLVSTTTDEDELAERWAIEMIEARNEVLQDVVLVDTRTGTAVSHRDVGIGVSQVLPVLVAAYASKGSFLAIEQPEIHLHPALQAELGDVFLQSALKESKNTFLIETHSEHLILRILRRIRETTEGDLPRDVPAVRPDQVAVLYVQPSSDGVDVINIPITPEGEFERAWPNGFFSERAEELF